MFLENYDMMANLIDEVSDGEAHPVHEGGWIDMGEIFTSDDINMLTESYEDLDYTSNIEEYM